MLKKDKIVLRPLDDKDASALAVLANNKKIADNLRDIFPFPYALDNAVFFINMVKQEKPTMTFAIEFDGVLCGVIGLVPQPDVYKNTAEIGYWIGEPFWSKGIATEAVNLITRHAFNELNFIRIHTGVFQHNTASMRVLEKCGFKNEGVFEKAVVKNGKILNEHRFAKIK